MRQVRILRDYATGQERLFKKYQQKAVLHYENISIFDVNNIFYHYS